MSEIGSRERQAGEALFALVFFACALFLLSQMGSETKFSAKGQLFAQPAFWPAVGVVGMCFFGALHALTRLRGADWAAEAAAGGSWVRALEYLAWFMAYVAATPVIGYLAATLLFALLLAIRAGYRDARMLGAAMGTGLAIVLIFKTALSVKIPGGAVYEHLPNALRSFMIIHF